MKIVIKENHLWLTGLGILMFLNYAFEVFLYYGVYYLINHWIVTGNETLFFIVGLFVLMFGRFMITMSESGDMEELRTKLFNFHLLCLWGVIETIKSRIPLSIEIRK